MKEIMKQRFRMFRRQGGVFYIFDRQTGHRESLETDHEPTARRLLHAKNEAEQQPIINRQIARAYLAAGDPEIVKRTWQTVMDEIVKLKGCKTRDRWETAIKDKAFDSIRNRVILETNADQFLRVLEKGTVSTNVYLRRLHNFALDMNWLPWPVVPKRQWPPVCHREKRAITLAEHQAIIAGEHNVERRTFYELCWHLGGAQTDVATLTAEDIDWESKVVSFHRHKSGTVSIIRFGKELEAIMRTLPQIGPLFPKLKPMREAHRATEFARCCRRLMIKGITLHSYRYAWAERARTAGYPERFAQEALGHNSKAMHRAYARKARVVIPTLEDYEKKMAVAESVIVPMPTVA